MVEGNKHTHTQHSSNSNIKIVHNSIEHFVWNQSDFSSDNCPLLSVDCFHKLCLSGTHSENSKIARWAEILGDCSLTRNESVPWEVLLEVFLCSILFEN